MTTKKDGKKGAADVISKFKGDGLSFKAKFYGTAAVKEARGDSMCQQALQLMKVAVRTTSQHKQKIIIRINISGVTLLDAINNQTLHHHQVNKISFISKDPTDSRSFCYIVGGDSDGKHTLFGLKTDKPSEAVVLSLRDLFQAVYQLNQQKRSSRASSTLSVESVSRNSVNSSSASLSVDNSNTNNLPLNITAPASPTSVKSASLSSESERAIVENPPDVIPVVTLNIQTSQESGKEVNTDTDAATITQTGAAAHAVADDAVKTDVVGQTDPAVADTSILKQIESELSFNIASPEQNKDHSGDVSSTPYKQSISSPDSSIRSNSSSTKPAASDSLSLTSNEPQNSLVPSSSIEGKPTFTANPWESDVNFGDDPFTDSSPAVPADSASPWGDSVDTNNLTADSDPWAAFGTSGDWASENTTDNQKSSEDNPLGSSDPWGTSPQATATSEPLANSGAFEVDFSQGFSTVTNEKSALSVDSTVEQEHLNNTVIKSPDPSTVSDGDNADDGINMTPEAYKPTDTTVVTTSGANADIVTDLRSITPEPKASESRPDSVTAELTTCLDASEAGQDSVTNTRPPDVSVPLDRNDPFGAVTPDPHDPFSAEPDPFTVSTILTATKTKSEAQELSLSQSPAETTQVVDKDPFNGTDDSFENPNITADPFVDNVSTTKEDTFEQTNAKFEELAKPPNTLTNVIDSSNEDPFADKAASPLLVHSNPLAIETNTQSDPFAESDPFGNADPFNVDDPFGGDPFSNGDDLFGKADPFSKTDPFDKTDPFADPPKDSPAVVDPFATGDDPFASSMASVNSLKVDSDPFSESWADFLKSSNEQDDDAKQSINIETSSTAAHTRVDKESAMLFAETKTIDNSDPAINSDETVTKTDADISIPVVDILSDNVTATMSAEITSSNSSGDILDSNNEVTESDDDQLSSGPPSCPPPTLPPDVLSTIAVENIPVPVVTQPPIRKPPPAIPARRPVSAAASTSAALPPVPSRSRASSQIETTPTSSLPPGAPPPSLPQPKASPPQIPSRSMSVQPPAIPERPKRSQSTNEDRPPVIGNKSIPLTLPRHSGHSDV